MENLFATLKGTLPAGRPADIEKLNALSQPKAAYPDIAKMPIKDLVSDWQKTKDKAEEAELLKRMQPTIRSAMTTYAPGMENRLAIKAAKLTIDALKTYNSSYGAEPSTYVFHNLKRLSRLSNSAINVIPQSESLQFDKKMVTEAAAQFEDRKGREPSMQELADLTHLSKKRLDKILNAGTVINESATLTDDNNRDTFAQSTLKDEDYLEYVYASVDPVGQKIIEWSSGIHGKPILSNNQIAEKLRMTPAAVSQRRNKIQSMLSDVRELA